MTRVSKAVGLGVAVLVLSALPASAHTVGGACVPAAERCERWSAAVQGPPPRAGERPDEFPRALAVAGTTVYAGVNAVALPVDDPYAATGSWTIEARDLETGVARWRIVRRSRAYDSLHDLAVSPDGRTIVATGGAYDAFPVAATDSRIVTVAFDAVTGAELWSASWDRRSDGTDTGKVVAFAPDGRTVFVAGVSSAAPGDLDYVTIAYDARKGRERWVDVYAGLGTGGSDALYDLAVSGDGEWVYVTGESAGVREYDRDYATVAYRARNGQLEWISRYDGGGLADRARALAVAGGRLFVTGDSFPGSTSESDTLTVALDTVDGRLVWTAALGGPGYDGGRAIVAGGGRVVVTSQTRGEGSGEGLDALTAAYDATSGGELWRARLAEPQRSELANGLALAPGGELVYLTASSRPVVQYTALDEQRVLALELSNGSTAWRTHLDAGAGNALTGDAIAVSPDGSHVATLGQRTRGADPLGPRDQDVYDTLLVAFDG